MTYIIRTRVTQYIHLSSKILFSINAMFNWSAQDQTKERDENKND